MTPNSPFSDGGTELVEAYDYLLKFIVIGESGTGKTCLLHHFLNDAFKENSPHTIGVAFSSTILRLPSSLASSSSGPPKMRTLKLQLWDTAGQERFRSVTRNYYRSAIGVVLSYDITRRSTFDSLSLWLSDARALASPDAVAVLVGNKVDREDEREVPWLEASRWAKENDLLFIEVSSLTGENVSQPFVLLARSILLDIESGQLDPDRAGSGVSYGERALKRVSSWGSGLSRGRGLLARTSDSFSGCC